MTLEIDVDKLKARRGELEAELSRIDNLLLLATEYSKYSVPVQHQPEPLRIANGGHREQPTARGMTPGLRRAVTLALHTGPATEADLARALAWDIRRTRVVLFTMLKFRICFLNEHGRLQLSDDGQTQAAWFLQNPSRLSYSPQRIA